MYFEYNFSCNTIECMIIILIMQEAMVVSYQKITHLQKISYHNTSQRRYDIYQIKIRDMRGIMRCKVLQDNTSNKHLRCIDSILQDMLSIDTYLVKML